MQKYVTLTRLARLATSEHVRVTLDSQFIGRLSNDSGWFMTNWKLPWLVLYLIHEGSCQIQTPRQMIQAGVGQAVLLDPCRTRTVKFSNPLRYSEIRFRIEGSHGTWAMRSPVIRLQRAYPLAGYIDQLASEVRLVTQQPSQVVASWLGLILTYAQRFFHPTAAKTNHLTTAQLDVLIQYVQQHLGESIDPADLAKVLHLSPDYFSRLFKSTLGQSPRAWLARERIRHACHLLEYSLSNVDQIALQVGYANTAHFCRQFRHITGITPNASRQQVLKPNPMKSDKKL